LSRPKVALSYPDRIELDGRLSEAAHELRAPVGVALIHAGLAELQLETTNDVARAREAVLIIKQQMMRLDAMLSRVLRLTSDSDSTLTLRCETVDLTRLIPETIEQLARSHPQLPGQVRVRIRGEVRGTWDASAVGEVLTNLLSNAVKFGEERPIDLNVGRRGGQVAIEVRDRGIGIHPSDHQRIFERFTRVVPARSYPGLGLGLWIARTLVEAQGGSVKVFSVLGRGAMFTVRLPVLPASRRRGPGKGRPDRWA
jgi:signal transduction histidine kinase